MSIKPPAECRTIGDVLDAVLAIETREEAHEWMAAYRAESVHAAENIGYLAGYCDTETAQRIWDWFECAHPVFGTHIPTSEEAFETGKRWAAEATS